MRVAIIGFGRFGQLLGRLLKEHHGAALALQATSRSDHSAAARALGLVWVPYAEAARADVLILCVPIRELASVLDGLRDTVRPGALVVDTCSVKIYPARIMAERLPASVEVLASHPLFGPDGVSQLGIVGQRLVSCPIRIAPQRLALVEGWFQRMGVEVVRLSPDEHDRQAAISQGLVHFIGRAIERAGVTEPTVTTSNAGRLFALARSVATDSPALFEDIETFNPYAAAVRRAFIDSAQQLDDELRGQGHSL